MYILWRPKHKNEGYKSDNDITEGKKNGMFFIIVNKVK
jgi:hypothetical protein